MRLKPGVKLEGITPQIVLAACIVRNCYREVDPDASCTITSANDSKHSSRSLHYQGKGLDFRTHDVRLTLKRVLLRRIQEALGDQFDVLLENEGTSNEHIHVEWDPK